MAVTFPLTAVPDLAPYIGGPGPDGGGWTMSDHECYWSKPILPREAAKILVDTGATHEELETLMVILCAESGQEARVAPGKPYNFYLWGGATYKNVVATTTDQKPLATESHKFGSHRFRQHDKGVRQAPATASTFSSSDRGIAQFNDKYESNVSDTTAYDVIPALKAALDLIRVSPLGYNLWVSWRDILSPAARANGAHGKMAFSNEMWHRAMAALGNRRLVELGVPPMVFKV